MKPGFLQIFHILPVGSPFLAAGYVLDRFHNKPAESTKGSPKTIRASILLAIVWLMCAMSTHSAVWYVNHSATGANIGSDWNNAWTDFSRINWSSVSPGDTIFVAGGSYGYFATGKSGTASAPITIERVRSSDAIAVLAAGWQPAFDSQVVQTVPKGHSGIYINQGIGSFLTVDGRVNAGWRINISDNSNGVEIDQAAAKATKFIFNLCEPPPLFPSPGRRSGTKRTGASSRVSRSPCGPFLITDRV